MHRAPLLAAASLLVLTVLAGCTQPSDDADDATPDADTYALTVTGLPSNPEAGQAFTYNLRAAGDVTWDSDHIGGHYGRNSTDAPSTTAYTGACVHQAGSLPGDFVVTCTLPEAGAWYLRGHARIVVDGEQINYWSVEHAMAVMPAFNVSAEGVPATVASGMDFAVTVNVTGGVPMHVLHVAAHFGRNSTATPSLSNYDVACAVHEADVPDAVATTCRAPSTGTWYLRGHMIVQLAGQSRHYWSNEVMFTAT